MKQVTTFLTNCWLNYFEKEEEKSISYLSPIPGPQPGWYIWPHEQVGVYELLLLDWTLEGEMERSTFLLKHYPSPDQAYFEELSCSEQAVRLSDYFDDSLISIGTEPGNNCACCPSSYCREYSHKTKGIPRILARRNIDPAYFTVGSMSFLMENATPHEISLQSQDLLLQYSVSGINVNREGNPVQLVPPGGVDRRVRGWELSEYFLSNIFDNVLKKMPLAEKRAVRKSTTGQVFYQGKGGELWEVDDPAVTRITHTIYF